MNACDLKQLMQSSHNAKRIDSDTRAIVVTVMTFGIVTRLHQLIQSHQQLRCFMDHISLPYYVSR